MSAASSRLLASAPYYRDRDTGRIIETFKACDFLSEINMARRNDLCPPGANEK